MLSDGAGVSGDGAGASGDSAGVLLGGSTGTDEGDEQSCATAGIKIAQV